MANEKRLIDAKELRAEIYEYVFPITHNNFMGAADAYYRILHLLEDAPTIDAVEVVRCKDCLWFDQKDKLADVFRQERHCYCTDMNTYMPESGFCSSGERKDNERKAD